MEILDLYDKDGNKLNKTNIRGTPHNKDEYNLAVDVWIENDKGQILLTQRHPSKLLYPMKWECTSGFVKAGEDSLTAALREVNEETGIRLNKNEGKKIHRIVRHNINIIFDIFMFTKTVDIKNLKIQADEVINIKWAEKEELKEMFKNDEMVEPLNYIIDLIL